MRRFVPPAPSTGSLRDLSLVRWENATLYERDINWHSYAFCYRRAADALVEEFAPPAIAPDGMFLPILFLYRHYAEVSLKGIWCDCTNLLGTSDPVPKDHRLDTLWRDLRPLLSRASKQLNEEWLDRVEELVLELHALDPGAMHFRYPKDKKGAPLALSGLQVSPRHVRDAMKDLYAALDNAAGDLSSAIECRDLGY